MAGTGVREETMFARLELQILERAEALVLALVKEHGGSYAGSKELLHQIDRGLRRVARGGRRRG